MAEKYVGKDGSFLVVCSNVGPGPSIHPEDYRYYLAWFFPSRGETGANVGEFGLRDPDAMPRSHPEWEAWVVDKAVRPLAEKNTVLGYVFDSETAAQLALDVATVALKTNFNWTEMARAAGWVAP
jgi:hypothetical protein